MVELTMPIADANERKYKGLNIPTEDWMWRTFERLVVDGEDVYVNLMAGSFAGRFGSGTTVIAIMTRRFLLSARNVN